MSRVSGPQGTRVQRLGQPERPALDRRTASTTGRAPHSQREGGDRASRSRRGAVCRPAGIGMLAMRTDTTTQTSKVLTNTSEERSLVGQGILSSLTTNYDASS